MGFIICPSGETLVDTPSFGGLLSSSRCWRQRERECERGGVECECPWTDCSQGEFCLVAVLQLQPWHPGVWRVGWWCCSCCWVQRKFCMQRGTMRPTQPMRRLSSSERACQVIVDSQLSVIRISVARCKWNMLFEDVRLSTGWYDYQHFLELCLVGNDLQASVRGSTYTTKVWKTS